MTIEDVLTVIDQNSSPGDWFIGEALFADSPIRHRVTRECPICFVASQMGKNPNGYKTFFSSILREIDLSYENANTLAAAADLMGHWLRGRLESACRLSAQQT